MIRWALCGALFLGTFGASAAVRAEQYVVQTPSGPKIAHTNPVPVVVHRILPPYLGRHIYRPRNR